jgi:hypothetical protein
MQGIVVEIEKLYLSRPICSASATRAEQWNALVFSLKTYDSLARESHELTPLASTRKKSKQRKRKLCQGSVLAKSLFFFRAAGGYWFVEPQQVNRERQVGMYIQFVYAKRPWSAAQMVSFKVILASSFLGIYIR